MLLTDILSTKRLFQWKLSGKDLPEHLTSLFYILQLDILCFGWHRNIQTMNFMENCTSLAVYTLVIYTGLVYEQSLGGWK